MIDVDINGGRSDRELLEAVLCGFLGVPRLPTEEHRRAAYRELAGRLGVEVADVQRWWDADRLPRHLRPRLARLVDAATE